MTPTRLVLLALALVGLTSCAAIKGTGNTVLYAPVPPASTFAIQQLTGDPVVGRKIERMIGHQMTKHGHVQTAQSPDLLVSFAFDVSPAGSTFTAYTTIHQAPQTAYVFGNTVTVNQSRSTATTFIGTTREFQKSIAIRISKANTGERLWEGTVTERGWCNQIFVTSPQILSLMFQNFPNELTNLQKMVTDADESTKEIRRVFPADTNWGCRPS